MTCTAFAAPNPSASGDGISPSIAIRLQTTATGSFVLDVRLQRFRLVVREWTRCGRIRWIGTREYLENARFVKRFEFLFDKLESCILYRRSFRGGFEKVCADVKRGAASGGGAMLR